MRKRVDVGRRTQVERGWAGSPISVHWRHAELLGKLIQRGKAREGGSSLQ